MSATPPVQHPPHVYLDNAWYFLTASTINHRPDLVAEEAKAYFRDTLRSVATRWKARLLAWVILDDHYHLLLRTKLGENLPQIVAQLHGSTSHWLNQTSDGPSRSRWRNYWDTCVRTEPDLWTRFNYIHHNPVKHGYVKKIEDWKYSSYGYYVRTKGAEWLQDCWERYPIVGFQASEDAFQPAQPGCGSQDLRESRL